MNWIKTHKLASILILIVLFLLFQNKINTFKSSISPSPFAGNQYDMRGVNLPTISSPSYTGITNEKSFESAAVSQNGMVIKNSDISLLVEDVVKTGEVIISYTKSNGGFMVMTSYSRPSETPFGTITVRIPSDKLDESLKYFRSLSIKVTNENILGEDITEQYTDIQARLKTLQDIQAKYNDILTKATQVEDLLNVQRELINIQGQIDSVVGQQLALEKNAQFSRITISLSSDELALPYTPDTVFRPDVVFKLAIRSLLNTLRQFAELIIWVGVYAVIWIPLLFIFFYIKRWRKRKIKS